MSRKIPSWVHLDYFLVTLEWTARFPKVLQASLPLLGLDHAFVHLKLGGHFFKAHPFKFE